MKAKLLIVAVFLVVAATILYRTTRPAMRAAETTITMLYGTEKQDWIESVAVDFRKANPDIDLRLVGVGSLDGAQAILDGKQQPTVFSPADSLVMNLLASDWKVKHRSELFAPSGEDAPQPLVITPLVFVIWEDRAEALRKSSPSGAITWQGIRAAVVSNQGWSAVGGSPDWGFVKLGHTDPTRSNSGLQALWLMTLEFYRNRSISVGDLLQPDYQQWVRETERGVSRFESSTGTFMTDMVRFGPSKYDVAVVYESLAVAQLENAQGRWGNLRVYYPPVTLWSDHPAAVLQADWVTDAQKRAARTWIAYLRGRTAQGRALDYGFRPADPSVPIKSDAQNPFTRNAGYGVQLDLPPVARQPDGAVVRALLTMWSRIVTPR
jgi:ABC-type molybdate transport system substrate-binding protein